MTLPHLTHRMALDLALKQGADWRRIGVIVDAIEAMHGVALAHGPIRKESLKPDRTPICGGPARDA